jgi:zinc/manganese transport system substrate-binding protein
MRMKAGLGLLVALCAALFTGPVFAAVNVFACEPEWAALAKEVGGDKVSAVSATTALQDPHRIEARPSLIARIRSADLVICSGSELEAGWLPLLITQSGNDRVQPGTPGFIEASQFVARLEVPRVVDRSQGDIHPGGNPHIHLDPRNIERVAEVVAERLEEIDRPNAEVYKSRADSFRTRWTAAMQRWRQRAARLRGVPIVVHHRDFSYFINWAGMREVGSLEPKPGIPPTPSHLAQLIARLKRSPAKVVVYSAYNDPKAAEFLSEQASIPAVKMPYTVDGTENAKDLFALFDDTIDRLLEATN